MWLFFPLSELPILAYSGATLFALPLPSADLKTRITLT